MQGRLSKPANGRIQSFPWRTWKNEFELASQMGFKLIEWTIDDDMWIQENPIMTDFGRAEIDVLARSTGCSVLSLTADCMMSAPFWKARTNEEFITRVTISDSVVCSAIKAGVKVIVVPTVDQGSFVSVQEETVFIEYFQNREKLFLDSGLKVAIESDYDAVKLKRFIANFSQEYVGVNYDIGNSASLGYNSSEEIDSYGDRIINIHIKDRCLNGATVPLGDGNADIKNVFNLMKPPYYSGNWIFQAARAKDGDELAAIRVYINYVSNIADWIITHE